MSHPSENGCLSKQHNTTNVEKNAQRKNLCTLKAEVQMSKCSHTRNRMEGLQKVKNRAPSETALPCLGGFVSRQKEAGAQKGYLHAPVYFLSMVTAVMWRAPDNRRMDRENEMNSPVILSIHKEQRGLVSCRGMTGTGEHCPTALSQTQKDRN